MAKPAFTQLPERWQFRVRAEADRLVVTHVRRAHRRWQTLQSAPRHVRDYLGLTATDTLEGIPTLEALEALETVRAIGRGAPTFEVEVPRPQRRALPPRVRGRHAIHTLADLLAYFESDTIAAADRTLYKQTACGASLSVYGTYEGHAAAVHSPGRAITFAFDAAPAVRLEAIPLEAGTLPPAFVPTSFTIQTIVEGSDATVDSAPFVFGRCTTKDVERWIAEMEDVAAAYWRRDNLSLYRLQWTDPDGTAREATVECGWGECAWASEVGDAEGVPTLVRTGFTAWYEAAVRDEEPEEGEVIRMDAPALAALRCTAERLDRSGEMY